MPSAKIERFATFGSLSGEMDRTGMLEMNDVGARDRETLAAEPRETFAPLAEIHLDAAYRLATFILTGDRAEAEDAVHDAAVRAWRHFDRLKDHGKFEPWFTRIVVNCCRDRLRARRIRPLGLLDTQPSPALDVGDAISRSDALASAMRALSPEHRIVIALRYLGDYSIDEIAARTGVRAGTVKSRLHYALRSLRATLEASAREGLR
jgi:RNA polymerase sigma-70 factor, ECF subfamily